MSEYQCPLLAGAGNVGVHATAATAEKGVTVLRHRRRVVVTISLIG
jgi:hypothetical protein